MRERVSQWPQYSFEDMGKPGQIPKVLMNLTSLETVQTSALLCNLRWAVWQLEVDTRIDTKNDQLTSICFLYYSQTLGPFVVSLKHSYTLTAIFDQFDGLGILTCGSL